MEKENGTRVDSCLCGFTNGSRVAPKISATISSLADARIESALALIEDEIPQGMTSTAIAARLGLSRSRLDHLFKEQTGVTFRTALRTARVNRARRLLADPRLRVKEIAAQCGYAATSNLTREFRRQVGLSPSAFRRSTSGQQIAH
jgi:transcriptional regulator GlxA family with amidase domain